MKYRLKMLRWKIQFLNKFKREESGAVIIIVTVAMVVFMSMAALVIDVGSVYLKTGQIQKAADAAVYSAGRMLPVNINDTAEINTIKDSAIHYAELNGFSELTRSDVVLGGVAQNQYTNINVTVTENSPMNFARALGINNIEIARNATAKLSPITNTTGVAPLGLLKSDMDARLLNGNLTHVTFKYGTHNSQQTNFAALDLGDSHNGSDYRLWLTNGYEGEISNGDILIEENGSMVGLTYQGFSSRFDACTHFGAQTGGSGCTLDHYNPNCMRIVKIIIYTINTSGTVKVDGFAAFLLESQTQNGYITGSFLNITTTGSSSGGSVGDGSNSSFGLYNLILSQ